MKTLLVYYSKQQSTHRCMEYIASSLTDATLTQISEFKGDLNDYDHIIIGTPIYAGSIHKQIKSLIDTKEETLLQKQLSIVVCAMNDDVLEEAIERNFNDAIRNHATIVHAGGSYDFTKLNFIERFLVKKIAKVTASVDALNFKALDSIIA
mgnify:CR=1 FL=1